MCEDFVSTDDQGLELLRTLMREGTATGIGVCRIVEMASPMRVINSIKSRPTTVPPNKITLKSKPVTVSYKGGVRMAAIRLAAVIEADPCFRSIRENVRDPLMSVVGLTRMFTVKNDMLTVGVAFAHEDEVSPALLDA